MACPVRSLNIDIGKQELALLDNDKIIQRYQVSTAKNGPGQMKGSECTPTGWHSIRAKIGTGVPINSVFVARRPTGEIYSPQLASEQPQRDWILTRILWLGGLEAGDVDTAWRYIYIHGCPDELMQGIPESHGCIRMRNADVMELFDQIDVGCRVLIHV